MLLQLLLLLLLLLPVSGDSAAAAACVRWLCCCCCCLCQVALLGPTSDNVLSGSDDGHVFIWDFHSGRIVGLLQPKDEHEGKVVNSIQVSASASCCHSRMSTRARSPTTFRSHGGMLARKHSGKLCASPPPLPPCPPLPVPLFPSPISHPWHLMITLSLPHPSTSSSPPLIFSPSPSLGT